MIGRLMIRGGSCRCPAERRRRPWRRPRSRRWKPASSAPTIRSSPARRARTSWRSACRTAIRRAASRSGAEAAIASRPARRCGDAQFVGTRLISLASLTVDAISSWKNLVELRPRSSASAARRAVVSRSCTAGTASAFWVSACSLFDDRARRLGREREPAPEQILARRDSRPRATVGTSGSAGARCGVLTASATTLPSRMLGSAGAIGR